MISLFQVGYEMTDSFDLPSLTKFAVGPSSFYNVVNFVLSSEDCFVLSI